jgi:hypothetical protein
MHTLVSDDPDARQSRSDSDSRSKTVSEWPGKLVLSSRSGTLQPLICRKEERGDRRRRRSEDR